MIKVYLVYPRGRYALRVKTRSRFKAFRAFLWLFFTQPRQVIMDTRLTNSYRRL